MTIKIETKDHIIIDLIKIEMEKTEIKIDKVNIEKIIIMAEIINSEIKAIIEEKIDHLTKIAEDQMVKVALINKINREKTR